MGFDMLLNSIVFFIYSSVCIISIIFTFSLDTYIKINETLKLDIFSTPIITPLEIKMDWFNGWAMQHNKVLGPILIILSIIDLKIIFTLIYVL